ncbi:hypothetical protein [Lysinibacillus sp. NPDC059133]
MKKFRGKKRYFHNLSRELDVAHYDLDFWEEGWGIPILIFMDLEIVV